MRQHDAEGRIHIKWLRLSTAARVAGGGIAHMGDAGIAHQVAHIARAEHIAHHAGIFMHMEHLALGGYDARRILSAVLQHLQSVIQQLIHRLKSHHAQYATHKFTPPALAGSRHDPP